MAKQGKKQVLVERILAMLSDEEGSKLHRMGNKNLIGRYEVAKIIDDIYRKMHGPGASDLASKSRNGPSVNAIVRSDVIGDSVIPESKTCCPCGSSMDSGKMIRCVECGVRLRQSNKELKTEKNELRDEKTRLKAEKERLDQQMKVIMTSSPGFMPHLAVAHAFIQV